MSNFCMPLLAFRPVGRKPATTFLGNPQHHLPRPSAKPGWLSPGVENAAHDKVSREDVTRCLQIWFDYYYPASAMGFRDPQLGAIFLKQRTRMPENRGHG